jgi:hypothetical protein
MPPPLFIAFATSLVIVLRFDGSLCPPRDPMPGFTYPQDFFREKKPLDGGEKLASCSATITISSPCDGDREEMPIAIGGRYLSFMPHMTSAIAEYEGLLLGLEWLERSFSSAFIFNKTSDLKDLIKKEDKVQDSKLIIRGDCRLVIDQLNSRSNPRKMESQYKTAMTRIECVQGLYAEYHRRTMCENLGTPDVSVTPVLKVCFEHVPREENYFCDALCKLVINQKQFCSVKLIQDLISLGEANENDVSRNDGPKFNTQRRSRNTLTMQPTSIYLKQALDEICHNQHLCHSSRLALACVLVSASIRKRDVAILICISGFFLDMSRRWSKIYYYKNDHDAVGSDTLKRLSIHCEELSKHFSRGSLEYGKCPEMRSIFEFCTNYILSEYDCDDDDLPENAALTPYVDISSITSNVKNERQKFELLRWNLNIVKHYSTSAVVANTMWTEIPRTQRCV